MKNLSVGVLFVIFATSGYGQDLAQKVTIALPAEPAAKALGALGKQVGVPLETTAATGSETLVVQVKDVALSELMAKVAKALGAEWKTEGTGFRLIRTTDIERAQIEEERQERVKALAAAIHMLPQPGTSPWNAEQAKKYAQQVQAFLESLSKGDGPLRAVSSDALSNQGPAGRALGSILRDLGPSALAPVDRGQRIVFSTSPTRMQRPLPGSANQALAQFVREQQLYTQAHKDIEEGGDSPGTKRMIMVNGLGSPETYPGNPDLGIGKALLVASRIFGDQLQLNLIVADPHGLTIGSGSISLAIPPDQSSVASNTGVPITFSPLALEFGKAVGGGRASAGGKLFVRAVGAVTMKMVSVTSGSKPDVLELSGDPFANGAEKISKDLREFLLHPEDHDPLSLAPGEGIQAVATASNENLVACLPDQVMLPASQSCVGKVTTGSFLSMLRGWKLKVEERDGWLTVSPGSPVAERTERINRTALGKIVRSLDSKGYLNLAELGAFANSQFKAPEGGDFDYQYINLIDPGSADKFIPFGQWTMLRFYGSMGESQRRSISSDNQIALSNLSPQQVQILSEMVFNSADGPTVGAGKGSDIPGVIFKPYGESIENERTEILPNGVLIQGTMDVKVENQPAALARNSQTGASMFASANQLATQRLVMDNTQLASMVGSPPKFDRYQLAYQTTYHFEFGLAKDVSFFRSLTDAGLRGNSEPTAFENLPADFQKQVAEAFANLKNKFGNIQFGSPTSGPKPPL